MRQTKSDLKKIKNIFILFQTAVLFVALAVLFLIMILGYREKVLHILLSKLDVSTEAMASQLKASQVPLSSTGEHGIFIISQNDGAMVIDRHNDAPVDKELWASYRTKLIYEMQKRKRGWIVYPDKQWWNLRQDQKIIRYMPINELGWILAAEVPRPTEIELLSEAVNPSVYRSLYLIFFLGAFLLWFMTNKYFNIIRRYIAHSVESNLMSLGGEDKVFEEFSAKSANPQEDLQKEAIGLSYPSESAPVLPVTSKELPESKIPLQKPGRGRKLETTKENSPLKMTEVEDPSQIEEPMNASQEGGNLDQLTINTNNIRSPILKKIIKQFRNK
ncbi:MAG: hypothetical protein HQL12_06915 [Candidatus Omnitrophica bacterium]|nr:hypothetical protein [Candidatus Omnitrophota bacterium]